MRWCIVTTACLWTLAGPFVRESAACSCVPRSPCQIFDSASAVFLGTVVDVQEDKARQVAHIQVERVWKGQLDTIVSVATSPGTTASCSAEFKVGQRRVVFASGSANDYSTSFCAGGGVLAPGGRVPDLPPVAGRVSGRVYELPFEGLMRSRESGDDPSVPVPSARVWFETPAGRRETTADADGRFQFDLVPPGPIALQFDLGPALEVAFGHTFALANTSDCAAPHIVARPSGRVVGRVQDKEGRPVGGVHLNLVPHVESRESTSREAYAKSDASGRFEFKGLGAGEYVLGINIRRPPRGDHPYAAVYYPGVGELAHAQVLGVGAGDAGELEQPFVLPRALPTRELTVEVVCRDGSVPPLVTLDLVARGDRPSSDHEASHQKGRMTVPLLRDVAYDIDIKASIPLPRPDTSGRWRPELIRSLHVEAGTELAPVRLTAPFTDCAERQR